MSRPRRQVQRGVAAHSGPDRADVVPALPDRQVAFRVAVLCCYADEGELTMRSVEERFWSKVDRRSNDECWEWRGARTDGYGQAYIGAGKLVRAHRFAYELLVGKIPAGLPLDHLCRNRACVNPAHLEPVDTRTNLLRGETLAAHNAAKTHCHRGHELSGKNVYMRRDGRDCRTCAQMSREKWAAEHPELYIIDGREGRKRRRERAA